MRRQLKITRGFLCDPKHVWFSSVFSLGIKTHARDEFSHSVLIGYQTYELLMSLRKTAESLLKYWNKLLSKAIKLQNRKDYSAATSFLIYSIFNNRNQISLFSRKAND